MPTQLTPAPRLDGSNAPAITARRVQIAGRDARARSFSTIRSRGNSLDDRVARQTTTTTTGAKALAVRGGGMVEQSTAIKAATGVFGLYSAQMLLVPKWMMEQNFKTIADPYTAFITRIAGVGWLSYLYCLNTLDASTAFGISFAVSVACAIVGPVLAELRFDGVEPNTAHGAVYVLFPVLLGLHALAL